MKYLKVKINDKFYDVQYGTTLYEISRLVKQDFTYPILCANVNNVLTDLSKSLETNANISFYDRTSEIGNRVYARSLEFLVTVSAKKVLKEGAHVIIDYSLDNGIYCEVEGQRITQKTIDTIYNEMKEMVSERLKFKKIIASRIDTIEYFEKRGMLDKVKNLRYTTNQTITLHTLNDTYDYYFGPLVYDTGQINLFELIYLKENSFLITFPNKNKPKTVTDYQHHKLIFEEYRKFSDFTKNNHLKMVNEINDASALNKTVNLIRLSEAYYEHQISLSASKIAKKEDLKIILITGPSSSGKTTTSKKLELALKVLGVTSHRISLDDYFVDRDKTPKDKDGNYNFAHLKAIDLDTLEKNIKDLLEGKEVKTPTYNFIKGKQEYNGKTLKLKEHDVLIIEGIHAFNDNLLKSIPRENKYKIYLSPLTSLKIDNHNRVHTSDIRKIRRIVRDSKFRGYPAIKTLRSWENVVKEAYDTIFPFEDDADTVINTSLNYELGVLRVYAEPLLYAIDERDEHYPEVTRLINLLRNFLPISSENVPKDSLLREFIGGGIYNEEE